MNLKPKNLAQAFWSTAAEEGASSASNACETLEAFNCLYQAAPAVRDFFHHPGIALEQKKQWIDVALRELKAPLVVNSFLMLLVKEDQLRDLSFILHLLKAIKNEALGIVSIETECAEPLTSVERGQLETMFKKSGQAKTVELHETINPELLGGVVFKMDGQVFNASLKNRLRKIKHTMAS